MPLPYAYTRTSSAPCHYLAWCKQDEGYYCPSASVTPTPCRFVHAIDALLSDLLPHLSDEDGVPARMRRAGFYCPRGSAAELPCPAGTRGNHSLATALNDCVACDIGTACVAGSSVALPCSPGRYSNETGSPECHDCPRGFYQDLPGRSSCTLCVPGSYCPDEGSASPVSCPSGTYSSQSGLQSIEQCLACPKGFYCPLGSNEPVPW